MNQVKHLYIHIPFCKHLCSYCDFVRFVKDDKIITKYFDYLIKKLKKYKNIKFDTIYLGGGTPNSTNELYRLLQNIQSNIHNKTELTIECNPEFVTKEQALEFKKFHVNRISLGAQVLDDQILKKYKRHHAIKDVKKAIDIFNKYTTKNISLDFIYGFNELTNKIIDKEIAFILKNKIKHVSFYSLELKDKSEITKNKYQLNDELIQNQCEYINKKMSKYNHYEISNWSINKKYESKHNLAYWNSEQWIGIGYGAFGFERKKYYKMSGSLLNWKKIVIWNNKKDLYFQTLMMALRTKYGLNLNIKEHKEIYDFYKDKLNKKLLLINKKNIKCKNFNLLNTILLDLI